jgi:hypothetical protein
VGRAADGKESFDMVEANENNELDARFGTASSRAIIWHPNIMSLEFKRGLVRRVPKFRSGIGDVSVVPRMGPSPKGQGHRTTPTLEKTSASLLR